MIYIIGMACMTGTLSAQTVVDYSTFEQKVLDYSQTLKQSVAQRTACLLYTSPSPRDRG